MEEQRILLVDDDHGVNFLNRHILMECGVQAKIEVAVNGQEALNNISSGGCPRFIFLDINMPVMDGFEFLVKLKENRACYAQSQVYMLTSSLRESDKTTALSFECVKGYIEKPLDLEKVKSIFNL